MKLRRVLWVAACVLAVVLSCVTAFQFDAIGPLDAQAESLVVANPGMEAGFSMREMAPEVTVADEWNPWYINTGAHHRPEYKPETLTIGRARVHSGEYAQKSFTTYALHDGGLMQVIEGTEQGQWYEFSAYVWNWCSSDDNPDISIGAKCSALVGINPWGSEWPLYRTTIWGQEDAHQGTWTPQWVKVTVTAQAWSDRIVVFLRGASEWGVKHQDWYWDDTTLIEIEGVSEPCLPCLPCSPYETPEPGTPECISVEVIREIIVNREPVKWPRN